MNAAAWLMHVLGSDVRFSVSLLDTSLNHWLNAQTVHSNHSESRFHKGVPKKERKKRAWCSALLENTKYNIY